MPKGAEFNNPSKREKKLRQGRPVEIWKDGTTNLPSPPSFKVKKKVQDYQVVDRINLLLQKINELENRVARLEGQLRKRKGK